MIRLKILDLAKKTTIDQWYKFYLTTLNWNRKQIEDYRCNRLRLLIQYCFSNNAYYRRIMQKKKISPSQINSIEDLQRLPIIDRDTIRKEGSKLISNKIRPSHLRKGTSSGTTGIPITYYYDVNGLSAGIAAGYVLWSMSGWIFGQKNVHIWGNETSIQRWKTWSSRVKNKLIKQLNIPSVLFNNPDYVDDAAKKIIKFNPVSIEGYSSSIYSLAQHFICKGYKLTSLRQVLTTAENLEDYQRESIEKIFAPTGDLYGAGEILGISTRPIGFEKYYVFEPHVILETVDSGIPRMKDVVVTDLDNYGMPFIRYKIGDIIDDLFLPEKDEKYPFIYFKKLIGRSSDIIQLPNGKRFHPVNIFGGTLFRKFPEINRHKVIWNGKSLKFLFENPKPLNRTGIEQHIRDLLAIYDVPYSIEYINKMHPSKSGKYTYFEKVIQNNKK